MLVALAVLGLLLASFIAIAIAISVTGNTNMAEVLRTASNAPLARTLQAMNTIVAMVIPTIVVAWLLNRKPLRLIGFRRQIGMQQVGLVLLITILSMFIGGSLGVINEKLAALFGSDATAKSLEKIYNDTVRVMIDTNGISGYFISLLVMAILPAIGEEMLFRGGLQNFLSRWTRSPWLAIIIVAIIFSAIHGSIFGFLTRFFLGVVLGAIYYYTQNIWLSILAHFLNNAVALTAVFFVLQGGKTMDQAMETDFSQAYWGLLLIPLLFVTLRALPKWKRYTELDNE